MPAYCRRAADKGFDIYFEEPLDLIDTGNPKQDAIANTRNLLDRAEAWIASDPGQWMPLERIWPTTSDVRAKPVATASKS
jgi:lauroyl/myristoyl acyltransferase